jgi:ribonucleoside-diphosphate reductase beta chain
LSATPAAPDATTVEPSVGPLWEGTRAAQPGGLNPDHTALRLFRKAKRLGVWNPDEIDFSRDREDWQSLTEPQRGVLTQLASEFVGGEEVVTLEIVPLLRAVGAAGYLEDQMYLTSFVFEEAKHVDFFNRFLHEVLGNERPDAHQYFGDNFRRLFFDELPRALQRLDTDPSPERQAEASVVYNMIAEGVVAETGYFAFYSILRKYDVMPGTLRGIRLIQQDESRHIRYGVYLLERLIAEHGEPIYQVVRRKMEALEPVALGIHREDYVRLAKRFGRGEPAVTEIRRTGALDYAERQYQKRAARIEKARGKRLEEVLYRTAIEQELEVEPA